MGKLNKQKEAVLLSKPRKGKSFSFKSTPDMVTDDGKAFDIKTDPLGGLDAAEKIPIYRTKYVNGKLKLITTNYKEL